ncbi:MAG: hypothetical protein HN590_04880, partial [Calditrichaeota bacterium]|nr:hypothetical protein [Calditrichota bacterium]
MIKQDVGEFYSGILNIYKMKLTLRHVMTFKQLLFLTFVISTTFLFSPAAICHMTIEPAGLAVFLEQGNEAEAEIAIINSGEVDVNYSISFDDPPD